MLHLKTPVSTDKKIKRLKKTHNLQRINSECLEYSVGLNAWAEWIRLANTAIDKANVTGRKVRYYKSDIAQLNVDELNTYLCHFVRELVKPNGERYSCAALYYVVLGLNLYLIELGRVVNFISDDNFRVFSNSFHQLLLRYENRAIVGGRRLVWSRISEVILWDARQLGAHSPKVLLDTIMFFITKHFRLKATVHHANIRFKHIFRHILRKRNAGGSYRAYLQYYGPHPQSDNDYDSESDEDVGVPHYRIMRENNEDDSKCPVRLYEFFISKCPAAAIRNNNRLYLLPEKDYDPDGDVWFTQAPLPREIIARTVLKLKMIDELKD